MDRVGLSETRRLGSDEISSRGFTYYWFGMNNGASLKGVSIDVSSRLQPSVAEIIPVDERTMRLRLKHTLNFMSLVVVYAPTKCLGLTRKKCSSLKLTHLLSWATSMLPLALRELAMSCIGFHGSGTRNTNSSLFLNLAKSRRLGIAGSWHQKPELHHLTWYSNAGRVAKGIDHILVSTDRRFLQNCRVFRSAEIFATGHRLVVATLKLRVKSRKISKCDHNVFHLEKLTDSTCAHDYAVT